MKTLNMYALITLIFLCISTTSCNDKENDPPYPQETETEDNSTPGNNNSNSNSNNYTNATEKSRYYVKYDVEISTRWTNTLNTITFVTDKGVQTLTAEGNTNWSATYGPLTLGKIVSLKIIRDDNKDYEYGGSNHARIYISKDQEPFVIKAEDSGGKNLNLSYTIDF